nr:hypothetical protein [Tanacetum cinerariifolium]
FVDFRVTELDELGLIIKKKKSRIVKELMIFVGKGVDSLLTYLVMASNITTPKNTKFYLKLRKLIADHPDQEKLSSKRVKLAVKDNKEKDKIRAKPDKIKSKWEARKSPDSSPTKSKPSQSQESIKFFVIHQPPQEISIQEMEDLKQQYLDEMKSLINSEYRVEIKIDELKGNFNRMSIEINKKEKLQKLEQVANLSTYPSKRFNSFRYDDDDDEDYTVVITPDLLITDSLIMENEHLDTIPKTESNEFIKSSVENLVPIPCESEDFSDIKSECDMPDCNDSQKTKFSTVSNPLFNVSTSSDDESSHEKVVHEMSFKTYLNPLFDLDEEIISTSYPKFDSLIEEFSGELAHIDLIPPGINEANCDPDEDIHLVERLLYDNSSPILVEDSDPFMEKIDLFLASDGSIPLAKTNNEKVNTTRVDNVTSAGPKVVVSAAEGNRNNAVKSSACWIWRPKRNLINHISKDSGSYTLKRFDYVDPQGSLKSEIDLFLASDGSIPLERLLHDDPIPLSDILDFSNVVRVFLRFFTYPVTSSILLSSGSEDTIFDPGISDYHFSSFMPGVSHRSGTFMKFIVYPNHLNESPMKILSSTCSSMDQ